MQFAYEYYAMALAIPPLVIVARRRATRPRTLEALLSDRRGSRVEVRAAGARRQAQAGRARARATRASRSTRTGAATSRRARAAATRWPTSRRASTCRAPPVRIECYDISNLGETYAVASMVVFEGGAPAKAHYRTFTMRYEGGPDDFARMEEALQPALQPAAEPARTTRRSPPRPGLVVIDGGKGQLGAALARDGGRRASRTCRW